MNKTKLLIKQLLLEALFGKKFKVIAKYSNGIIKQYFGMATPNMKPGENPYRITWVVDAPDKLYHVDLTIDELNNILASRKFPEYVINKARQMWGTENIANSYTLV